MIYLRATEKNINLYKSLPPWTRPRTLLRVHIGYSVPLSSLWARELGPERPKASAIARVNIVSTRFFLVFRPMVMIECHHFNDFIIGNIGICLTFASFRSTQVTLTTVKGFLFNNILFVVSVSPDVKQLTGLQRDKISWNKGWSEFPMYKDVAAKYARILDRADENTRRFYIHMESELFRKSVQERAVYNGFSYNMQQFFKR